MKKKTYTAVLTSKKDYVYHVKDGDNLFVLTYCFNNISDTYMGAQLKIFDDNWQYLKRNLWILDIQSDNISKELQHQGFEKIEATNLDKALAEVK